MYTKIETTADMSRVEEKVAKALVDARVALITRDYRELLKLLQAAALDAHSLALLGPSGVDSIPVDESVEPASWEIERKAAHAEAMREIDGDHFAYPNPELDDPVPLRARGDRDANA